ncbi:MSMEG_1061 family FMN-dependent PPOX-type flavoprotein [Falsiroseomonas sp. HW251]|uniref:MSMEG_1061 family FMN-dependent PPOX-type flavoprotein n=1 Tax=Falsiroseomonas sp. HW251 TaxID=3390998 RepID=UPI003D323B4E
MNAPFDPHAITTPEALEALYGEASEVARAKEGRLIGPATRAFIAASPFLLLGTNGPQGLHVTPRGDAPGFVEVADERTLVLPDRRGNNRLDALRDILHDPCVALLFLVPGASETLRVHGRARITTDPALRERHAADGKPPTTLLVVAVDSLFMQCGKALIRSRLWEGRPKAAVPTLGKLIAEHTAGRTDAAALDARMPEVYRKMLY